METMVPKARRVSKALKAPLAQQVPQVQPVLTARQAQRVPMVPKARRVSKV